MTAIRALLDNCVECSPGAVGCSSDTLWDSFGWEGRGDRLPVEATAALDLTHRLQLVRFLWLTGSSCKF